ncbi:MAG: flagellar motor switch protein FliN [bacterium]|nr:flagellar motor switch protein FliN [bacterium]
MADGELDFSNMEESDEIDWSDVEAELQQNREMIKSEASGGGDDFGGLPAELHGGEEVHEEGEVSVDFLMDIPLTLRVEVGKTRMLIKDLLKLDLGSIVELAKNVGEPMDILINEKRVAQGEIVIQHEKFALKITDIMNKEQRLASLKG